MFTTINTPNAMSTTSLSNSKSIHRLSSSNDNVKRMKTATESATATTASSSTNNATVKENSTNTNNNTTATTTTTTTSKRPIQWNLLDIVNENPKACRIKNWQLLFPENNNNGFRSWSDFTQEKRISFACDRGTLIDLLTPPLVITAEEKELYALALHCWPQFQTDSNNEPYRVILRKHSQHAEVHGLEEVIEMSEDLIGNWSWQRKLLFLLMCIFGSSRLSNMIASVQEDVTKMSPRLNGIICSLIYRLRVDGLGYRVFGFFPTPSGKLQYRQRLFGSIMNFWDLQYRLGCGMIIEKSVVLNRYAKQEKFYFLLLAHHALLHSKIGNQTDNYAVNPATFLGVLRMMFAVQHTGFGDGEKLENVSWMASETLQRLLASPKSNLPSFTEIDTLYRFAKIINRVIIADDVAVSWQDDEWKRKELLEQCAYLVTHIPLNTKYVNRIKDCFALVKNHALLPRIIPHRTRYYQFEEIIDKLVATYDYELLSKLEKSQGVFCLVDQQIAIQVKEYYNAIYGQLTGCTTFFTVGDIYDHESQKFMTLLSTDCSRLVLCQAISWCASVQNLMKTNQLNLNQFNASGMCMLLYSIRHLSIWIVMFRILLLQERLEVVWSDLPAINDHAELITQITEKFLLQLPVPDKQLPLHPYFEGLDSTAPLLDYLQQKPELNVSSGMLWISLLLLPFLKQAKISKSGRIFLNNMLTYSHRPALAKDIVLAARQQNQQMLADMEIGQTNLISKNVSAEFLEEYETLELTSEDGSVGTLKSVVVMFKRLAVATNPVGSATLLTILNLVSPVLEVDTEFISLLFPAIPNTNPEQLIQRCTETLDDNCYLDIVDTIGPDYSVTFPILKSFFSLDANWEFNYTGTKSAIPLLHVNGHSFLDLCLPEYIHNGELINPVFTSFLQDVSERKHTNVECETALALTLASMKQQQQSSSSRSNKAIPPVAISNAISTTNGRSASPPPLSLGIISTPQPARQTSSSSNRMTDDSEED